MSMPKTCPRTDATDDKDALVTSDPTPDANASMSIPDFLIYIHEPEYDMLLRELIRSSLTSVVQVFFADEWPEVASDLYRHTYKACKQDCLVLFYLMLNVDAGLKKRITLLDSVQNRRKLGRFMCDLKHTLVPEFYTSEQQSLSHFVMQCQDTYLIS